MLDQRESMLIQASSGSNHQHHKASTRSAVDLSEFTKAEAGATCLSLLIE